MYFRIESVNEKINLIISEPETAKNTTILFIGGMESHLLFPLFVRELLQKIDFARFAQVNIRSHPYFGFYSLNDDFYDIVITIEYIKKLYDGDIILMGHSTGCQSIMHFINLIWNKNNLKDTFEEKCKKEKDKINKLFNKNRWIDIDFLNIIKSCIFLCAVSDREYFSTFNDKLHDDLQVAMANPSKKFILERSVIKSSRFIDLFSKNGRDDIFSSDLDDDHYKNMNMINKKCHFVHLLDDDCLIINNSQKLKLIKNSKLSFIKGNHILNEGVDELLIIIKNECS